MRQPLDEEYCSEAPDTIAVERNHIIMIMTMIMIVNYSIHLKM